MMSLLPRLTLLSSNAGRKRLARSLSAPSCWSTVRGESPPSRKSQQLAVEQTTTFHKLRILRSMPDQHTGQNLDKTIDPEDSTDVPLVSEEDQKIPAHRVVLATMSPTLNNKEDKGFSCDMCDKPFPNNKLAKDLHMQRMHNIKTLQSTPGPGRTRPATKCSWCSYICKTKPSMSKHIELFHKDKKRTFLNR